MYISISFCKLKHETDQLKKINNVLKSPSYSLVITTSGNHHSFNYHHDGDYSFYLNIIDSMYS